MNNIKRIINKLNYLKEWFALLGVLGQLGVVTVFGFLVVLVSALFVGSIENSYLLFIDPPALPLMKDKPITLLFSFLLMLFGLVVTGFIISVLSSSLENTFRDIRMGRLKYLGENHTLIINYNHKVMKILQEINLLHSDNRDLHDVVILINDDTNIEKLQSDIEKHHFNNLHIFVRFGDCLSWQRYEEISILNIHSIIILSYEEIDDTFIRDNNNLRIVNLLFSNEKFLNYLKNKRDGKKPIKAIVEFTDIHHFDKIIDNTTQKLFLALAPTKILSNILNLSMINLDFYITWSQLLSFDGYEFYFIEAKKHNLSNTNYKDILLRHKNGLLIGISRFIDGEFKFLLNAQKESILKDDWLIFISENIYKIDFLKEVPKFQSKLHIEQPSEVFIRNVAIIGNKRTIQTNELLDINESYIKNIDYSLEELFEKISYEKLLNRNNEDSIIYDTIILNLDDELIYRIVLNLRVMFNEKEINKFVFLIDDALVAQHLETAGFKNTILSHLLISKYMAQISNQISLHKVFNILFVKDGPEINFINPTILSSNLMELKYELINNNMLYLGIITMDDKVLFESNHLDNVKKIIVLSNGDR